MRGPAAALAAVLVALVGGSVLAAEPASPGLFCEGPPAPPPTVAASRPVTGPHWRDLELSLLLATGVAAAVSYVAGNERRRRLAGTTLVIVWTPYLAGASLGVVFAVSLLAYGRPLGVSAGVQEGARLLGRVLERGGPSGVGGLSWPLWVVIGVALGGMSSALLRARAGAVAAVPASPGRGRAGTWAGAFAAGVLMQVAAGIAGGCTSGLALSGGLVLAPAAFVFMAAMFIGGIPTAWLAARLAGRRGAR
jgi:uncharacterized protein